MALTQEDKEKWIGVLQNTSGTRDKMQRERKIPQEYLDWKNQTEREEMMLPSPSSGVPVRVILTKAKDRQDGCPIYVNMHGGGFMHAQDGDDDMYCAHVAARTHGIVVDVDYALSTEHPFPTAFQQSYDVVKWAVEQCTEWKADAEHLVIGGSSAGGNLAAAVALKATQEKDFQIGLVILDYAAIDLDASMQSQEVVRGQAFSMLYADGNRRLLKMPYCSPCFATDDMLKNHPKTLIITAGGCPFKKVDEEYGMRLAANGTEVIMKSFMNSNHAFTIRLSGEWQEAQELIIQQILER